MDKDKINVFELADKMVISKYISELQGSKVQILTLYARTPADGFGTYDGLRTFLLVEDVMKWISYVGLNES